MIRGGRATRPVAAAASSAGLSSVYLQAAIEVQQVFSGSSLQSV